MKCKHCNVYNFKPPGYSYSDCLNCGQSLNKKQYEKRSNKRRRILQ